MRLSSAESERTLPRPTCGEPRRIGVLLVNLGTPEGTGYRPMRRYLKEFLSDRRVIEVPRALWWPILNLAILTVRPTKSGAKYASIWDRQADASPLLVITRSQTEKLAARLAARSDRLVVDFAMRYGNPSIAERHRPAGGGGLRPHPPGAALPAIRRARRRRPCTTRRSSAEGMRWQPALRVVPPCHDDPRLYRGAGRQRSRAHLAGLDFEPELILASFHGVPKKTLLDAAIPIIATA